MAESETSKWKEFYNVCQPKQSRQVATKPLLGWGTPAPEEAADPRWLTGARQAAGCREGGQLGFEC